MTKDILYTSRSMKEMIIRIILTPTINVVVFLTISLALGVIEYYFGIYISILIMVLLITVMLQCKIQNLISYLIERVVV